MQDVMLSGSDAAIIPIGISFLLYLCWFYLSMHLLVIAWILHNLLFSCWCRLGRFYGMQSTFPEEQWSHKSIAPLGQCMLSIILLLPYLLFSFVIVYIWELYIMFQLTYPKLLIINIMDPVNLIFYFLIEIGS